jgi:hypothetical protein
MNMNFAVFSVLAVLVSSSAWASEKRVPEIASATCTIESRVHSGYEARLVIEFGDLKIKVREEYAPQGGIHSVLLDLKAPQYLKRGVELQEGQVFTDTICGSEVSVQMHGASQIIVRETLTKQPAANAGGF